MAAPPDLEAKGLLAFDGVEASGSGGSGGVHAGAAPLSTSAPARAPAGASTSAAAGALHLTAAVVGVGILSLPHCMAALGPGPGALALAVAGSVSLYTALLLARLGAAPALGRPPTYADLADAVLASVDGGGGASGRRARAAVMALQGKG